MNSPHDPLPLEVDVHAVKQMREDQADLLLLDCREQVEYDLVRIDGATLLPMSEIQNRLGELLPHRQRRIVVYCHHGGRSLEVAWWLRQQGFASQNMTGGIDAWAVAVDPSLPRY